MNYLNVYYIMFITVDEIEHQQTSQDKMKMLQTNCKCVEQIDLETDQVLRIYPSIIAAANFMGVDQSSISECCTGKQQTCGGFKWRY